MPCLRRALLLRLHASLRRREAHLSFLPAPIPPLREPRDRRPSGARVVADAGRGALPGLADRVTRLGTETAFDTLAQVNQLRAQGRDIISFGIGEPDFATPENIVAAGKSA